MKGFTVYILGGEGGEEGYTTKYGLIRTLIISKSDIIAIFSIVLRGGVILEEVILRMSLSGRAILCYLLPAEVQCSGKYTCLRGQY